MARRTARSTPVHRLITPQPSAVRRRIERVRRRFDPTHFRMPWVRMPWTWDRVSRARQTPQLGRPLPVVVDPRPK
jgi:hypothetical protein